MKGFIYKLSSFLFILFAFLFGFEWITSKLILANSDFELKDYPKYLVLGHSQPEHAFNDSLIIGLKNLAEGGESYFYTYYKSKEIIKNNPSIETVFIAFTNINIVSKRDAWTYDCYYMSYRLNRFSSLIDLNGKMKLAYYNLPCYSKTMARVIKDKFSNLVSNNWGFKEKLGGYKVTYKEKVKNNTTFTKEELRLIEINSYDQKDNSYSLHNLFYLRKLIDLCADEGKKVVLFRLPQRDDFIFWKNEELFLQVKQEYLNDIPFIDLSLFSTNPEDFIDEGHLSYLGAKRFSIFFNHLIFSRYQDLLIGNLSPEDINGCN